MRTGIQMRSDLWKAWRRAKSPKERRKVMRAMTKHRIHHRVRQLGIESYHRKRESERLRQEILDTLANLLREHAPSVR